ncbi:hypothetical protein AAVH_34705, partial [Aphelenchoides avenae]
MTAKKPYKCSTCDYASTFLGNLQQHENSPKDQKCPDCPMKFTLPCTLKKHMQLHAGKTHVCNRCGHKTQTQRAMDYHKRNRACAGEHKCEHCKYSTNDGTPTINIVLPHMEKHMARREGDCCPKNKKGRPGKNPETTADYERV